MTRSRKFPRKTTLRLGEGDHRKLRIMAKTDRTSMAQVIRNFIDRAKLNSWEEEELENKSRVETQEKIDEEIRGELRDQLKQSKEM